MSEKRQDDSKKIIRKRIEEADEPIEAFDDPDDCLSDQMIEQLYKGILSGEHHQSILEHLDKCLRCQDHLAYFAEFTSIQNASKAISKLSGLKRILPEIAKKLGRFDFKALCSKISEICQCAIEDSLEAVDAATEDILLTLQARAPEVFVRVRGQADEKNDSQPVTQEELEQASRYLQTEITQQFGIAVAGQEMAVKWAGEPELWVFDHLTSAMKQRATHIRDWCEARLERMVQSRKTRNLPSLGIAHSKRALGYAVDMLKAFENYFCDPLACYSIYVGAYCYHLGILTVKDKEIPVAIYKEHGSQTMDFLLGNDAAFIPPSWRQIGFSGEQEARLIAEICAGGQINHEGDLLPLPQTKSVFLDGSTMNISQRALSSILKLAFLLDCNEERLPAKDSLKESLVPDQLLHEYLKNELIEQVSITEKGVINITARCRYIYPAEFGDVEAIVKKEMLEKIHEIRTTLNQCGMPLPQPQLESVKSLFLDKHPYLGH